MLNPKLLLSIIIGITVVGLVLLALQWWITGGIITALGLVILYLWWRMNQLLGISQAIVAQDWAGARKKLEGVRNPDKLNAYSKTYYYFFQGMVETQSNNLKAARQGFKTALETNRFRAIDEKATALLMMAQLDLRANNKEGAKRYLREARALEPGQQIREQINEILRMARLRI
jgi:hypothetical protein